MLVDTSLVFQEIFVNFEASFDWSIGKEFSFNGFTFECTGRTFLDVIVLDGGTIFTSFECSAFWNFTSLGVVAPAAISDNTFLFQESPDDIEETTFAAHVACITGDKVLWGHNLGDLTFRGNAETISDGFSGTESPAGPAFSLISDWEHAIWPFSSGIEVVWV